MNNYDIFLPDFLRVNLIEVINWCTENEVELKTCARHMVKNKFNRSQLKGYTYTIVGLENAVGFKLRWL